MQENVLDLDKNKSLWGLSHGSLHYEPTLPPTSQVTGLFQKVLACVAKKAETLSPPAPGLGLQFHLKQATGASHAFQPCIAEIIFQVAQLRGPGHSSSNQPSLLGQKVYSRLRILGP